MSRSALITSVGIDASDARRDEASPTPLYRFDIHMQGDDETIFFDV